MPDIQCFLIVKNGITHRYAQRTSHEAHRCPGNDQKLHFAQVQLPDGLIQDNEASYHGFNKPVGVDAVDFPVHCDTCGYIFQEGDSYNFRVSYAWARADNGQFVTDNVHLAPPGAMWYADYMEDIPEYCGQDGKRLCVMTPGGIWMIDSKASNCTMPDDNVHKCWVRHGIPPDVTVDKNGLSCQAGAGSIAIGNYHGFLRNGILVQA